MVLVAPRSAKLIEARGARFTLLCGYVFCCSAFWPCCCCGRRTPRIGRWGSRYVSSGSAWGFAGTPASHSLTGSVPVRRAGMASGTADLQRDLGGAIMQSIFGALLTAGYASAVAAAVATRPTMRVTDQRPDRADEVVLERRGCRTAVSAVREPDHSRRASSRSSTATSGPTRPGSWRCFWAPRSCTSCSRRRTRRSVSSPSTTPRTRSPSRRALRPARPRPRPPDSPDRGSGLDRCEHPRRQPATTAGVRHDP